MGIPIKINSQKELIDLKASRYRVYVLGGFGVKLGQFSISLKHMESGEVVKCEKAFWPVQVSLVLDQVYAFGKRAKRILKVDILKEGQYEVLFGFPETLRIKRSNLLFSSLFAKPLTTENIEILITEKGSVDHALL